jgi:Rne/Rng family ribonuclease
MSKELVISATSHERRVAILEEGQLVEIYIEREKEFALVGSIYKGRVTRVLPGMQSAFVDIGLDGDAFLYVSDVFENLEDYDHGHGNDHAPQRNGEAQHGSHTIELLPGETLAAAQPDGPHAETHPQATPQPENSGIEGAPNEEPHGTEEIRSEEAHAMEDERQPESNESAPQNFAPAYNPTQYNPKPTYSPRGERGGDRGGDRQDFGRGDRGRGGHRGGGGRWGRRRGGRHHGQGGRNLPPSKYASPQGGERDSRGYENRGPRSFENRRPESGRYSPPSAPAEGGEEPVLLPGESLAKYRDKPSARISEPVVEHEPSEVAPEVEEAQPRGPLPAGAPGPRRSRGGLPSWLLADTGAETVREEDQTEETSEARETDTTVGEDEEIRNRILESHGVPADSDLSDEDTNVLSSSLIEAKQDALRDEAESDSVSGSGAIFEEEGTEEEEETEEEEDEARESEESELAEEESEEEESEEQDEGGEPAVEEITSAPLAVAEAEADAAHENAEHIAALGDHVEMENEHSEIAAAGTAQTPPAEEESILLPGETRAPRAGGYQPRQDFPPRDSARIGGAPRSRFQRPHRGGRDRGREGRGGRPDRRGGDRGRGRFERRGSGGGHYGQHRGHRGFSGPPRRPQLISEMLKAGQDVVVQIAKEPLGKKGARITSHVALPGRFLVYMPTIDHIGVSRKIASADNRSRLRRLVSEARGSYPGGFIVRTAAGGATDDEIRTDIEFLGKTWNEIKQKNEERKAPALLHRDLNLVERILRDYVSDDFTAIWIDNEEEYGKVVEFVSRFQPKLANRVKLYTKEQPIFEEFGIQHDLDKALRAKVWLKSGGYIVINHTEALVAIDVNTGKFVGKGSTRLEDTIVKTNLEAVKEIVRQIRLRDLGGIIVVDFIDMEERRNREKVLQALQQALEQDKAPSKALSFNEFGLVCITRKRTKQALERVLCQPCPSCSGSGMVKSIPTLCYEIQSEARKMAIADQENPNLTLRVHPEIAKALKTRESMLIDELEQNSHKHVIIQSDATLHWEQYDIY